MQNAVVAGTVSDPQHDLFLRYGKPVVRIATGSGGLRAVGDAGLQLRLYQDERFRWARDFRSDSDKIRPTQRVRGLRFSQSGHRLYVIASDRVQGVDAETGNDVWEYTPPRSFGFLVVSPVALDARDGRVAASFDNGTLAVWDEEGNLIRLWHGNDAPRLFRLLPDGKLVGTDSFQITVWDIALGKPILRRRVPERALGFAASDDGIVVRRALHGIVAETTDGSRRFWSEPAPPGLPLVAISEDGRRVAVAEPDRVHVHEAEERRQVPLATRVTSLEYCPHSREFLVGDAEGQVQSVA